MTTRLILLSTLLALPAYAQDWVAGIEANEASSYSYVTHYSRNRLSPTTELVYWQSVSYLTYEVRDGNSTVRVNSPGLGSGVMHRWNQRTVSAGLGAGYEIRWTERQATNENEQGVVLEGDIGKRFTRRTAGRIAARHSLANDWSVASADLRQEIVGRLRVGPQAIWQGNDDLTVVSLGGFVEIPVGSNVLQLRAGQARIEYRDGTRETKPYVSGGFIVPF